MAFEQTVPVAVIDQTHAEWVELNQPWSRMQALYEGGHILWRQSEQFLTRRPKELSDIYSARVERFSYHNHVGTAVDYYPAAMFEVPPSVEPRASAPEGSAKSVDPFYPNFMGNCDGNSTPLVECFRDILTKLLVFSRAYILIDRPTALGNIVTLADERKAGLEPHLRVYSPESVINWAATPQGELDWVIIKLREAETQALVAGAKVFDRWFVFDRISFAKYEREIPKEELESVATKPDKDATAELVDSGEHTLSHVNKVPVQRVTIPKGLWLMNRAFLPAMDHLNTDNVLSWALQMSALAMPIIMSDSDITPKLSEAGYLHLPSDATYAWTEPEGKSIKHLADREASLVENIYRAFYLIAQARSNNSTPTAQSGLSKQQDMVPSKKILGMFGDVMRALIQTTMDRVSLARKDTIKWDVRGLDFPESTSTEEIGAVSDAMAISVPSQAFERELDKKLVDIVFPDINPDVRQKIQAEIDTAPSREEREQKKLEQQASIAAANASPKDGPPE